MISRELREKLESLVFTGQNPYLSLDSRLQPFLDLIAECERDTIERCQAVAIRRADEWHAILEQDPASVMADHRWHEACEIMSRLSPDKLA